MKKLFNHQKQWQAKLAGKPLLILFDFDGTLAPIADTPEKAKMPAATRALLRQLKAVAIVGVISGRALPDVKQKVGVDGLMYAGNHGLEIEVDGKSHAADLPDGYLESLQAVNDILDESIKVYSGAFIENKGLTLTVHYRLSNAEDYEPIIATVAEALKSSSNAGVFVMRRGKMAIEIRPAVDWNKGMAVAWITGGLNQKKHVMYIGDDDTDEDAFLEVGLQEGTSVRVGNIKHSAAQYYVNDTREVQKVMSMLMKILW